MSDKPPNPVFWAMKEATRRRTSLADRVLLFYLANHVALPDLECWPSQPTLADECGMTERQVRRSRDQLRTDGLITFSAGTGRDRSIYRLLMPLINGEDQPDLFDVGQPTKSKPPRPQEKCPKPRKPKRDEGGHRVPPKAPGRTQSPPSEGGLCVQSREDSESAESTKKNPPIGSTGLRPGAAVAAPQMPPSNTPEFDPRKVLWSKGVESLRSLTGQTTSAAKRQIGQFLKLANQDAVAVLRAVEVAEYERPFEPVPWITKAIQARAAKRQTPLDEIRERWNLTSFITPGGAA